MPGSPAYNITLSVRLTGPTDVTALEESINEIIHRQEILRVTFSMQDEQPLQVIFARGKAVLR